jgi:hypothetical protein
MKKSTTILGILLLLITSNGISQPSSLPDSLNNDSITIALKDGVEIVVVNEMVKDLKKENSDLLKKVSLLEETSERQSKSMADCLANNDRHKDNEVLYQQEVKLLLNEADEARKALRKEKIKTVAVIVGAVVLEVLTIYLLNK